MALSLDTPIQYVKRVGPHMAKRLEKLGINTVRDLLYYAPFRYNDFSKTTPIAHARVGSTITVKGTVRSMANRITKTKKRLQEAKIADETGTLSIVWFNQPYLTSVIHTGDELSVSGKIDWFGNSIVMQSPEYELVGKGKEQIHTGRMVPVYPETEGISSKWLRGRINAILPELLPIITDPIPETIQEQYSLLKLPDALSSVHFPTNESLAKEGIRRLSFNELLLLQLKAYMLKQQWETEKKAYPIRIEESAVQTFLDTLPFELTGDQKTVLRDITNDINKQTPMNRLLEGDVGSGKTIVAASAMYAVWKQGHSSVFMAPTQILAQQHFETLSALLKPWRIPIELVTGNSKKRFMMNDKRLKKHSKIIHPQSSVNSPNNPSITIGTHALLQNAITFHNVAFVVIDEQQRFGVLQRALLKEKSTKGKTPHLLSMTATPIPRTLALTVYGNLDLSTITTQPIGRKQIKTWVVPREKRTRAYEWIRKELETGNRRAFIVCPFIEESESMQTVKAATKEFDVLKKTVFPDIPMALLHGKIKQKEKKGIIEQFKNGNVKILVTTPVVEVGIDIPTATIILIEGAERFGLSQLHQLRGRVGRGTEQSYCLLFTQSDNQETLQRLKALEDNHNGSKLAQIDLETRGAGDVFGRRQHGLPPLAFASLSDTALIAETKDAVRTITKTDPNLMRIPLLRRELEKGTIETSED